MATLVGLVRLINGKALLAVFLIRGVFQILGSQRQNYFISLGVSLVHSSRAEGLIRTRVVIL